MNVLRRPKSLLASTTLAVMIGLTSGCATINPGLQSGELPPQGTFIADNGMQFNIQPLSLANLPASNAYSAANNNHPSLGQKNARVRELLRSTRGGEYRISSSDILSINLIGYPEITPSSSSNNNANASNPFAAGYPVDQQGYIQFPLIGRIKASGLTVNQFTNSLRSKLQRYLKYPDPQVKIVNYRGNKFFIDGEVRQPGEFTIDDAPATLYSAISLAGGVTAVGDSNNVTLIRDGQQYLLGLRDLQAMGIPANQIYLQDGDAIHVNNRSRNRVYVLGEFGSIKPVEIPDQGLSLAQVLGEVQGLDARTADAAKLFVVRDHGQTSYTDIYHANLQSVTNLALANRFEMQPNDIIYVDPTGLTRWSRFIGSVLPSAYALDRLR
ncbi:polysaccharide biosynthesis/export family protein [Psychrobacter sp. FDAARGOS_221]|uniref:polysaccharide biosynthesis/export family protein n=1 Tax=Psychrobacter sp. FDAARGOS_221 TaxID=1975705 RepID=UPI000BB57EF7|nr:polysaccharide biosynthesis/export family protein [Psychrobacter sp. FDAARGOS_221]PNK60497.1 sugar ABC transporter substrate-binding protein [Psychrobacter sp. FDAARGOS_221]